MSFAAEALGNHGSTWGNGMARRARLTTILRAVLGRWGEPRRSRTSRPPLARSRRLRIEALETRDLLSVNLVGTTLSSATARDGQTLTLGYEIASSAPEAVLLQAALVSPTGATITDRAHEITVQLAAGTNTFTRSLFINLPGGAAVGDYDVVWTVRAADGDHTTQRNDALAIQPPVDIQAPILMYHKVGPVAHSPYWTTTEEFRAQMLALKAYGYTTVTLQDVMDYRAGIATPPAKPVVVTFDDGYEDLLTYVLPILADPAIDFKATSFLISELVGATNAWDQGDPLPVVNHLTWEQIATLAASGRFDFQSHTALHHSLTYYSTHGLLEDLAAELFYSKQAIETHLNKTVAFLCYPYGLHDAVVEQAVWQAGYFAATAIVGSFAEKFALPRPAITSDVSVNYNPDDPGAFFFSRIQEPIAVPDIAIQSIEYRDAAGNPLAGAELAAGQTVRVRVTADNSGPATNGRVRLRLDADADRANGVAYDSHQAGQDLVWDFAAGQQMFEFTWTAPLDASPGLYRADVSFVDQYAVLNFADSLWQPAFVVATAAAHPLIAGTAAADTFFVSRDATGAIVQVWQNAATPGQGPPTFAYLASQLQSLTLAGEADDDRLVVDFANGSPVPAGGLSFNGGPHAGGDTLAIIGTAADAGMAMTSTTVTVNGGVLNYQNAESFRFGTQTGSGGLVKDGPGTIDLFGPLTYSGATTVNGGTLQLHGGGSLPVGADLIINSGKVAMHPASTATIVLNWLFINLGSPVVGTAAPSAAMTLAAPQTAEEPAVLVTKIEVAIAPVDNDVAWYAALASGPGLPGGPPPAARPLPPVAPAREQPRLDLPAQPPADAHAVVWSRLAVRSGAAVAKPIPQQRKPAATLPSQRAMLHDLALADEAESASRHARLAAVERFLADR